MVVPADTEFTSALRKPLEVLQGFFDAVASSNNEQQGEEVQVAVAKKFEDIFNNVDKIAKIPTLASSLASLKDAPAQPALVRWRCMVQDTGLGTEMFLKTMRSSTASSKRSGYFGAADVSALQTNEDDTPSSVPMHDDYANLSERTNMFAVSLPGESRWHAEAWAEPPLSAEGFNEAATAKAKKPIPGDRGSIGALLKIYDAKLAEKIGVCDLVEVVGVLTAAPFPTSEWQSTGNGSSSSSSEELLPCVHVIFSQSITLHTLPPTLQVDASATPELSAGDQLEEQRMRLIEFLASALHGDKLAAEVLLLALVARLRTTRAGVPIGALTLNICDLPPTSSEIASALHKAIESICPAVVTQSLDLPSLNDPASSFFPRSDGENLKAGQLQVAKGTVLLVDEAKMGEGELKDMGVRNIRALNSVMTTRKLPYAFPFSEFEFDADPSVIVLSHGRSFLSTTVQVPLRGADGAGKASEPTASQLKAWRKLILEGRGAEFDVSPEMAEQIQKEFVSARQQTPASASGSDSKGKPTAFGQEDLLRRMAMARLHALSRGKRSLDEEGWKKTVELDEQCMERLQALPARQQA